MNGINIKAIAENRLEEDTLLHEKIVLIIKEKTSTTIHQKYPWPQPKHKQLSTWQHLYSRVNLKSTSPFNNFYTLKKLV